MSVKNGTGDNNTVPIITNVPINERFTRLNDMFYEEFKTKPLFFVRVPGRVNIIGEHIDYCGYPVLPMALEQDIIMAVGKIPKTELHLRNTNKKYPNFNTNIASFENIEIIPDANEKPFWYNYVLCGIKGALEFLENKINNGVQICVDGNIPPASGLSSSSALVSAACLAFLNAHNVKLSKTEIASLCAKSERYVGTQGGGMDQAIAFLAEKYSAQYITWQPLNAFPVALPEDAAFVVAHSFAEANKAATNDFNRRVIECRLAAKILLKFSGVPYDTTIKTLSEVQKLLDKNLHDMVDLVHKCFEKEIYTKEEICKILNTSLDDIDNTYLTSNTRNIKEFKLKQRALHVYEEAIRVEEFKKHCIQLGCPDGHSNTNGNSTVNGNDLCKHKVLLTLGELMSRSHDSLKTLYECSHEHLDLLVDMSKKHGVHSRLTGAGWGGCIVAMCPKEKVENYIELLKEEFYKKHCKVDKEIASSYVFATTPNHGAVIYCNAA